MSKIKSSAVKRKANKKSFFLLQRAIKCFSLFIALSKMLFKGEVFWSTKVINKVRLRGIFFNLNRRLTTKVHRLFYQRLYFFEANRRYCHYVHRSCAPTWSTFGGRQRRLCHLVALLFFEKLPKVLQPLPFLCLFEEKAPKRLAKVTSKDAQRPNFRSESSIRKKKQQVARPSAAFRRKAVQVTTTVTAYQLHGYLVS